MDDDRSLFNADVRGTDRLGIFEARLRSSPVAVPSADPEHHLCHAMLQAGLVDGEIQFWHGATPTLRFRSAHGAAKYRTSLANDFPQRVKRRDGTNIKREAGQVARDRDFVVAGYLTTTQEMLNTERAGDL